MSRIVKYKSGWRQYAVRNAILRELGFRTYADYLASEIWQEIRSQVMRARPLCLICYEPASELHHIKYHIDALLGRWNETLAPLCRQHHREAEVCNDGSKRMMGEVNCLVLHTAPQTPHGLKWLESYYGSYSDKRKMNQRKQMQQRASAGLKFRQVKQSAAE